MGFYDNPQIDPSSKHSEESEHALRGFLNQNNGFLLRPVSIFDKGVDFYAELIVQGTDATNSDFGIQLKSDTHLENTQKGELISYRLHTSRLGYLSRRFLTAGMVVVYFVEKGLGQCYFDYVPSILERLYRDHGKAWEDHQTVTIKIPVSNKLDAIKTAAIHEYYADLHKQGAKMQNAYGPLYGIPKIGIKFNPDEIDFNDPAQIVSFLEKHGTDLLMGYDIAMVAGLIGKLTDAQVSEKTKVLCIAAAVNCELGKFDLSEVLCNRAFKRRDLSEDERILILFANAKNQYQLKNITLEQLSEKVEQLKTSNLSPQNRLTIDINLLYGKMGNLSLGEEVPEQLKTDILALFEKIEDSGLSQRVRFLLTLWNSDNYSSYINAVFLRDASLALLSNSPQEQIAFWKKSTERQTEFIEKIEAFFEDKSETNNFLVRAFALQIWVKHLLHFEISLLNLNPGANHFAGMEGNLERLVNRALTAYNYFSQEGFGMEAYHSLCFAMEFVELGKHKLNKLMYEDEDRLKSIKCNMEEELTVTPYELLIPRILSNTMVPADQQIIKNFSKEQLAKIGTLVTKAKNVPPEFAPNVMAEIIATQEFYRRCTDPTIELLTLHQYPQNPYAVPLRYILRKKSSGIESAPRHDISILLKDWGF